MPSGFYIGSRFIAFYGITMTIAILVAYFVTTKLSKHRGISNKTIFIIACIGVPAGIIGARFLHVMINIHDYTFVEAIAFWKGFAGMSIYGALIFGLGAIGLYCFLAKVNFLKVCDVIAPGFILAQAIGRWGNFFNQELYGPVVKTKFFPFAVYIEATGEWHAAMFFYEFLANFAAFFVLLYLLKKRKEKGIVLAAYLIIYGTVRAILEPFRQESVALGGFFRPHQFISFAAILAGLAIVVYYIIKGRKARNVRE